MTATTHPGLMGSGGVKGEVRPLPVLVDIIAQVKAATGVSTSAAKKAGILALKARQRHGRDVVGLAVEIASGRTRPESYNPLCYSDPTPAEAIRRLDGGHHVS